MLLVFVSFFFFQAEDGIRDGRVTGVQTCALPISFREPERLIRLYEHSSDDAFPFNMVAGGIFAAWKDQSHGFSDLAIVSSSEEYNLSGASGQLPEKVRAAACSWVLFPTLGVEPALGRAFNAADD